MAKMSSSAEIHSVILNLNKNLSNNVGSNFRQIVNQQLEIKPNTLVALYSGNIVRKPIVIEENVLLDLELTSMFPTLDQENIPPVAATNVDDIVLLQPQAVSINVPKGYYSKLSFGRTLCELANDVLDEALYQEIDTTIVPESGGITMEMFYPYRLYFEAKDDNLYLGLRRIKVNDDDADNNLYDNNRVAIVDLDDGLDNTSNITLAKNDQQLIFQASSRSTNYDCYALGNQPILPMCYSHLNDPEVSPIDVGYSMMNINIDPVAASNELLEFCYTFNNTYFCSQWAATGAGGPPTTSKLVDVNEKPDVVSGLLGAYVQVDVQAGNINSQFLTLYCNSLLFDIDDDTFDGTAANINNVMNADMRSLTTIDLSTWDFTDKLGGLWCEVYAVDEPNNEVPSNTAQPNKITEDVYRYFFRWYIRTPYSNVNELTLVFDSKNIGLSIPNQVVDSAYLFRCLRNDNVPLKDCDGGLCPQFYFKNCLTDIKVSNPVINSNICYDSEDSQWKYLVGIRSYNFQPTTDEDAQGIPAIGDNTKNTASLQNVLGVGDNRNNSDLTTGLVNEQTLFNPQKFPSNKAMAGLTKLNSDKQRYNIELNLPVKAFNTTEQTTNDIGQSRTILYNTNSSVESQEENVTVGLINKELQPNNLKYLSLNNKDPIKINTLDVQIRRAKTNELAEEITDASLELVFYSEGNPHGKPPSGPY